MEIILGITAEEWKIIVSATIIVVGAIIAYMSV